MNRQAFNPFLLCILAMFAATPAWAVPLAGDVNQSGSVDAVDVQQVVLNVLSKTAYEETDLDWNGDMDAVDVQLVVLAALGHVIDADGDGLSDAAEQWLGTAPDAFDSDGDGVGDGQELANGTDPLGGTGHPTQLLTMLTAEPETFAKQLLDAMDLSKKVVDTADIASLVLTVTQISLHHAGAVDVNGADGLWIVDVANFDFNPADLTVEAGDTVRWVWGEDGPHTVTSGVFGDPDAGLLFDFAGDTMGDFGDVAFNTAGMTVPYFSEPDLAEGMTGTVEVVDDLDDPSTPSEVVVFRGALEVDVMDLMDVARIISYADIPPGKYTKIVLAVANPRVVLVDDLGTVVDNVKLTANDRLFISEKFMVAEGEDNVLMLHFEGVHLVQNGNGRMVLTPQLRAEIEQSDLPTEATGEITVVDTAADVLSLDMAGEVLLVDYGVADIYLPTDTDTPTGTEADLVPGAEVFVTGLFNLGTGMFIADAVRLLL